MRATQLAVDTLRCPKCGTSIPVTETISHQIAERTREEFAAESARREELFAQQARELATKEATLEAEIQHRLQTAVRKLTNETTEKVRISFETELEDLKRQSQEKDEQLRVAREAELKVRAERRALEDREKALQLELSRTLDEERRKVEEATIERVEEQHRLRDAEKDKTLRDALKANDELRRKLQQGSQQNQGEVMELQLEALLQSAFPSDSLEPVPKGIGGADIVQKVLSRSGHLCGTILWETKRTKAWSDGWVWKLKDDQRALKAELAVIVSEALPKDCRNFIQMSGVWVCSPECALNLAAALRQQLAEVAMTKLAAVGKNEKMEFLYGYLTGSEFKQRVEAIVEAFSEMQADLLEERRTTERRWAKREKQLQRVLTGTSGMYGDLQGLIGSSLQTIPALSLSDDGEQEPESQQIRLVRPRLRSQASNLAAVPDEEFPF
jgi:hypothetical protein